MAVDPPTDRLRFRWSWRPYQARLLDSVDRHLRDRRLHIVAAPGAGKTTLGLEVFRRLGRPALVLAPTLTIRDQWLRRLRDFLRPRDRETPGFLAAWTSSDLESPAFFTVATYQGVLSQSRADGRASERRRAAEDAAPPTAAEVRTLIGTLRAAGVGTLILDEAHHLKREWWRALERVVTELEDLTLVSLTGTPPYEATGVEWRRYEELCGPIDDEISVPELVKAGTLCPHQDFVYAVTAREREADAVHDHDVAVGSVLSDLLDDARFHGEVERHPWVVEAEPDLEAVLSDPEVGVALLVFLRATAAGLPQGLLDGLALTAAELPTLDRRWWQVLLREYVLGRTFDADRAFRAALATRLRERGVLWRRTLRIERSRKVERALSLSSAKIDACVAVHHAERVVRGEALRQVVLTDYIRADALDAGMPASTAELGALPIFDALVAARTGQGGADGPVDIALVTGKVSVIHRTRVEALRAVIRGADSIRESDAPGRSGWVRIEGVKSGRLVAAYTRLLTDGSLRTVVGTRSLLGEGWDAPVVNSLILASSVGASVSTNQMRGRAIRTDPASPDKVASVWHLVAVAPRTPTGFLDLAALRGRFRTFVGLATSEGTIVSGLERLSLPPLSTESDVAAFNAENVRRLEGLDAIARGWQDAIEVAEGGQVVPTVSFRGPPTLRPLHLTRTLRYVLYELGFAAVVAGGEALRRLAVGGGGGLGASVIVAAAVPMLLLAPRLVGAAKLAILHAPVAGSIRQIGRALLEALCEAGMIEESGALRVRTIRTREGGVQIALEGGTFYEQSLFADSLGEILGPVENPRYLITRPVRDLFGSRVDYHAVPHVLGARRALADTFHEAWMRRVGAGTLIYTRRAGGREVLLAARGRAFSNQFVDPAERVDRWQ